MRRDRTIDVNSGIVNIKTATELDERGEIEEKGEGSEEGREKRK